MRTAITAIVSLLLTITAFAGDYEDAWQAIRKKDFKQAKTLLLQATKNPATAMDAYVTLLYLQSYQGGEKKIDGFSEALLQHADKNAYLYPLWFNDAALGGYGKKQQHQLSLLNKVMDDASFNGSIKSASHYVKALHHVFSNDFGKAKSEYEAVGAITKWQLVGPFENLSGSGFENTNGPIATSDNKTEFIAANNVHVTWFVPTIMNNEGWIFTNSHIPQRSALVYGQSFVNAPEDMRVTLAAGCNGSIKVWVNDGLVLSEAKERTTELDYYKNVVQLKKGFNRILVQLGYSDNAKSNFIIRLTDENGNAVKTLSATNQVQPYTKAEGTASIASQKHFAEDYFEKKVAAEPADPLNYLLLSKTYLRNERTTEARQAITKALELSPDNPLLKFELIQCLIKASNRTLLMQEIEWLKENDEQSYINYQLKIDNLLDEEKYAEAEEALKKMKDLYGTDAFYTKTNITVLAKQEKIEQFLKAIEAAYNTYPENVDFVNMMFRLKKQGMKDVRGAISLYERYLKDNYNYSVISDLADEYKEQGMNDKYLDVLKRLNEIAGYDPSYNSLISKYYFEKQNLSKALDYAQQALALAPYTGTYWNNIANIQQEMGKKAEAIASLKKAIYYDRTNYDARKKLSVLEGKADLYKLIPETDAYAALKKAPAETKYNSSYVVDEKATIIYEEGASEEYIHYAVKLHNPKGVESWKEIYLNYNDNTQTLLVEKCEAVKANGAKVPAERNGAQVVFTGLEPGDAIHVKYRIQNYSRGRLGREYWDRFNFNAFVPSLYTTYTLIAPAGYAFSYEAVNGKLDPTVKEVDGYKMHRWETSNLPALKSEPYMPPLNDVGSTLHVSTLKTWADVASWYSDLAYQDMSNNFELNNVYDEIFKGKKAANDWQKAKLIYDYMLKNLRYSSVSFRQSGYVPQDVSKIISTRLGDCKDFSTLFVALAGKAGIPAQLVLVDTRDKGAKDMVLPSMEFNHCIAYAKLDGKSHYIELTDNNLPFASMPNNLMGALSLLIPPHGQKPTEGLKPLMAANRVSDKRIRTVNVTLNGKDETLAVSAKRTGHLTSDWRHDYATQSEEKRMEDLEQSVSGGYKNPVKLEKLSFIGLDEPSDSLVMNYEYTVKNEVIEAGSMKMIKVPFIDVVATVDNFSSDKRDFPIEYWNYENTDEYMTTVNVRLPAGQTFVEVPTNQSFTFKGNTYTVKYVKEGQSMKIIRTAKLQRETIPAAEYAAFKKFMNDIVEAESKYIVFK